MLLIKLKDFVQSPRLLLILFITLFTTTQAYSETIKIGGTGNALGTMKLMAKAYSDAHPGINIIVLPSIGSSGAIKAVPNNAINIGLSSRPLKEKEKQKGIRAIEYARSPTVIAVSTKEKVTKISLKELTEIYSGEMLTWPDGTSIRPIIRQPGDDNSIQLMNLSPALKKAVEIADTRPNLPFAATDQEAVDKIYSIPGGIGVTSLALIISENRPLRALTLDGVEPTPETASSGQYPMLKRFYLILPEIIPEHVQAFIAFISSEDGKAILKENGNSIVL
ncbi:substrate-binding domain-containing protein [Psychromonas sp.]|nr:substrate-binding domain-containing protein [Psychromonas sp.]